MANPASDALVFFGATGDLAYKQIFPALLAMVARDGLDVPVIGVAHAGWSLEQLRQRARDSVAEAAMKSAARSVATQLGRALVRGILGSLSRGR